MLFCCCAGNAAAGNEINISKHVGEEFYPASQLECGSTTPSGSPLMQEEGSPKSQSRTPAGATVTESSFHLDSTRSLSTPVISGNTDLTGLPKDVQQELREAMREREEGWPFAAEERMQSLLQRLQSEQTGESEEEDVVESIKATQVYCELVRDMEEVNAMLGTLLDDEGWTAQKEGDGVHVWTRPEEGSNLVTVRIAGVLQGPFDYFCAIGKEVQLVKEWMTGVKVSYIVQQSNIFDYVGYYAWKFPLITGREFLIEEISKINDRQGYCVIRRSPPGPREGLQLPEIQKGHIRACISNWCSFCAPVGRNERGEPHVFVVTVMNVDLKIPLPSNLVNMLSVKMGFKTLQDMRQNLQKAQEPSNPLHKSVMDPSNAAYYSRMRDLEKARDAHPVTCQREIMETGWVKDPVERRKIFARSEDVLVPMAG